jgi:predicted HicB family RNase H-like nuclease
MSQTLQHKGYDGSVLYSAEDKMLHGRVLGIRAEEHDPKLNAVVQQALKDYLTHAE